MKTLTTWLRSFAFACVFGTAAVVLAAPSQVQLIKEAKVTKIQAEKTALSKVPKGIIKSEELEREHGKLIWSFDIAKAGMKNVTEVQVDALTGEIASVKVETPKDQAKEAATDQAKKN